jgi:hypothetical protein
MSQEEKAVLGVIHVWEVTGYHTLLKDFLKQAPE